jgi:hypothetical protein
MVIFGSRVGQNIDIGASISGTRRVEAERRGFYFWNSPRRGKCVGSQHWYLSGAAALQGHFPAQQRASNMVQSTSTSYKSIGIRVLNKYFADEIKRRRAKIAEVKQQLRGEPRKKRVVSLETLHKHIIDIKWRMAQPQSTNCIFCGLAAGDNGERLATKYHIHHIHVTCLAKASYGVIAAIAKGQGMTIPQAFAHEQGGMCLPTREQANCKISEIMHAITQGQKPVMGDEGDDVQISDQPDEDDDDCSDNIILDRDFGSYGHNDDDEDDEDDDDEYE